MLQKLGFAPGFNKQVSELGAEGQWFDGDNVRFRYGTPEKIGGWDQLGADKLTEFDMFIQGVYIMISTLLELH